MLCKWYCLSVLHYHMAFWFVPLPTAPHLQMEEKCRLTVGKILLEREWLLHFLSCFNVERFIDFQVKGNICVLVFLLVCRPCQ